MGYSSDKLRRKKKERPNYKILIFNTCYINCIITVYRFVIYWNYCSSKRSERKYKYIEFVSTILSGDQSEPVN